MVVVVVVVMVVVMHKADGCFVTLICGTGAGKRAAPAVTVVGLCRVLPC